VPPMEQFANKSSFTGRPIVPFRMEKILPEYQYTPYTTEAAKILGSLVGSIPHFKHSDFASPPVIENYFRAWAGGAGQYALKLADELMIASGGVADPIKPIATLADIPFIKAFVIRHPSSGTQPIIDFYEEFDKRNKTLNTFRLLAKRGDPEALEFFEENEADVIDLSGIANALSTMNGFVHRVMATKDIDPKEKRQLIDTMYYKMTETAKSGNRLFKEIDERAKK